MSSIDNTGDVLLLLLRILLGVSGDGESLLLVADLCLIPEIQSSIDFCFSTCSLSGELRKLFTIYRCTGDVFILRNCDLPFDGDLDFREFRISEVLSSFVVFEYFRNTGDCFLDAFAGGVSIIVDDARG